MKFLLLDLDDTLLDFGASEADGLRKTLQWIGIMPTDEMVRRYSEINDAQWKLLEQGKLTRTQVKRRRFELLFELLGVVHDVESVRLYYEKVLGESHVFFDGAEQFLKDVYGKYALYIVSNGTTAVQNGRIARKNTLDLRVFFYTSYLVFNSFVLVDDEQFPSTLSILVFLKV